MQASVSEGFATFDTGAEATLLRRTTAENLGLDINCSSVPTRIVFGNSSSSLSKNHTFLGDLQALVVEDDGLTDDLVSANPLVDKGYTITLDKDGGFIYNPSNNVSAEITRDGPSWKVWLTDIESLGIDGVDTNLSSCSDENVLFSFRAKATLLTSKEKDWIIDLHESMGHPDSETMCNAISGKRPTWKLSKHRAVTAAQIRKVFKDYVCLHCVLAKRNLSPPSKPSGDRDKLAPGHTISTDLVGEITPPTHQGHRWFIVFKCVSTGYVHVRTVKQKNEFFFSLKEVVGWYKARGFEPKILRTDDDVVEINAQVDAFLVEARMTRQTSAPYRQFQNAVEREVQTLVKGVTTLLHSQPWLRADQWDLALFHYVACRNNTPNVHNKFKSPSHRINGKPTNLDNTFNFSFGDLVAVGIPKKLRTWKFDLRNDMGIYVGQCEGSVDTHFVYMPHTRAIYKRGSLHKVEITDKQFLQYFQRRKELREPSLPFAQFEAGVRSITGNTQEGVVTENSGTPIVRFEESTVIQPVQRTVTVADIPSTIPQRSRRNVPFDMVLRGSGRVPVNSARLDNLHDEFDMSTDHSYTESFDSLGDQMTTLHAFAAKISTKQALQSIVKDQWQQAIKIEMDQLFLNTLVPELPQGRYGIDYVIIHSTMQLKLKLNDDGSVNKYKARCCARGDMLQGTVQETYSPTVSALAYTLVHQIAIIDQMKMISIDTVGAYLYEDYPATAKPLYIKLERHVAEALGLPVDQAYRVKKYLYGLPDSGRAYYRGYSAHLMLHGYQRTISDPCLFVKLINEHRTYVWIHVDDTLVASTDPSELLEIQRVIGLKYDYTVNNVVDSHLGVHMTPTDKGIRLTQPKLLADIFEEIRPQEMAGTSKVRAPQSNMNKDDWDETPMNRTKYLHLLGALLYLTRSRPDIATAVSFGATHAVSPTEGAYKELLRCVQYLYNTREVGLVLRHGNPKGELRLKCYVDASYLTHSDSKSHTGYCLSFGDIGSFYSKSSKQTLVTTSSTHAEMRALYQAILDIIYVINLCDELHRPVTLPAIIMEDNQPVIDLTADLSSRSKKCKHFLMLVNFVREQIQQGIVELRKVPTKENLSDILTKIMTGQEFIEMAEQLLGAVIEFSL